jgi:hypothetical protein
MQLFETPPRTLPAKLQTAMEVGAPALVASSLVCWVVLTRCAFTAHAEASVGLGLQGECDAGYYLESESARARLYRAVVTALPAINRATQAVLALYIFAFVATVSTVFWVYKDFLLHPRTFGWGKWTKWALLCAATFTLTVVLTTAVYGRVGEPPAQLYAAYPTLTAVRHPRVSGGQAKTHAGLAAAVVGLSVYLVSQLNDETGDAVHAVACLALIAALAAVAALLTPAVYAGGVVEYEVLRDKVGETYGKLSSAQRGMVCKGVLSDALAATGKLPNRDACATLIKEHAQHANGREYAKAQGADVDALRAALRALRLEKSGVRAARRWAAWSAAFTVALVVWLGYAPYTWAMRYDDMVLGRTGVKYLMFVAFLAIFAMTFVGWFAAM